VCVAGHVSSDTCRLARLGCGTVGDQDEEGVRRALERPGVSSTARMVSSAQCVRWVHSVRIPSAEGASDVTEGWPVPVNDAQGRSLQDYKVVLVSYSMATGARASELSR
jgi:hypothetical protein